MAKIPEASILYNESEHNILALVNKANKEREEATHTPSLPFPQQLYTQYKIPMFMIEILQKHVKY